ncbi:MAG: hypothetical protein VR65_07175 [Desulfobulbaceae bacterium BRH_c16a]|nr:MAG: hypothetical protein VR65_07175 [Desulfobulbaceae bacterium BRH_c16a]
MTTFILTLAISFIFLLAAGGIVSFCKQRYSTTRHGLTGMCHETGGAMCGSCSSQILNYQAKPGQLPGCRKPEPPEL